MSRLEVRFRAPGPAIRRRAAHFAAITTLILAAFTVAISPASAETLSCTPAAGSTASKMASDPYSALPKVVQKRSATLLFLPGPVRAPNPLLAADLEQLSGFSVGLFSPTLGRYSPTQMILDIGQGSRVASVLYSPVTPQAPGLILDPQSHKAHFKGWSAFVKRADDVPGDIQPALLGCALSRAGKTMSWAGYQGSDTVTAIAAVDGFGQIRRAEDPPQARLVATIARLEQHSDVVVGTLPPGGYGLAALHEIAAAQPDRMMIVVESPPDPARTRLLPLAIRGIGGDGGLRSTTTRRDGLVSATDIAPTILKALGVAQPSLMQGTPITPARKLSTAGLESMAARLELVAGRRTPFGVAAIVMGALMFVFAFLLGQLAGRRRETMAAARRVLALAMLWIPALLLVTAAMRPTRLVELDVAVGGSLLLAVLSDRLVKWPRAPWLPVLVVFLAHGVDLGLLDSRYTGESLLGSNPLYGARFFGVGNELEAVLGVSSLIGVGAYMCGHQIERPARWFAAFGGVLTMFLGLGRIGADVGGVITAVAGFGVAALYAARMKLTLKRLIALLAIPVLILLLIAGLDQLTGGESHLTRTVLHANSVGDLLKVIDRRFSASFDGAKQSGVGIAVVISIALLAVGWWKRDRLLTPLTARGESAEANRPLRAALVGGISATVIGALANDSGPAILVIGTTYVLMGVLYVRGRPPA